MTLNQLATLRSLSLAFSDADDATSNDGNSALDKLQAHLRRPDSINDVIDALNKALGEGA